MNIDDDLKECLDRSISLDRWILTRLDEVDFPKNIRSIIAVSCYDVVIEHHIAIGLLIKSKIYGSAFALARPLFETFIRGVWLNKCANESDLKKYQKDQLKKTFGELIKEVEALDVFKSNVLSNLKKQAWEAMCSYTHGGIQQIGRRVSMGVYSPDYKPGEIKEVLNLSQAFALLAFIQMAQEANLPKLAKEALDLLYEWKLFQKK